MKKQISFISALIVMVLAVSPILAMPVATVNTSSMFDIYSDSDSIASFDALIPTEAHALAEFPNAGYNNSGKSDAQASIFGSVNPYNSMIGSFNEFRE